MNIPRMETGMIAEPVRRDENHIAQDIFLRAALSDAVGKSGDIYGT